MGHIAGKETANDKIKILEEHGHRPQYVWPPTAGSVTLTATASAWTHGAKVEVIAAAAVANDFDIHHVSISGISANGEYEVIIYSGPGASEVEIGRAVAVRNAIQSQEGNMPMMTAILPAGTRVSASVASSTGAADTVNVKLIGHLY